MLSRINLVWKPVCLLLGSVSEDLPDQN